MLSPGPWSGSRFASSASIQGSAARVGALFRLPAIGSVFSAAARERRTTGGIPPPTRLLAIHDGLMRILDEFRPDEAAVEITFVNKDAKSTLKLGQARGIAMVVPARAGVPVAEYAPNLVKKSIVGAGPGDKGPA